MTCRLTCRLKQLGEPEQTALLPGVSGGPRPSCSAQHRGWGKGASPGTRGQDSGHLPQKRHEAGTADESPRGPKEPLRSRGSFC